MGFALGFLPWVLYWALIGNVPFRVAAVLVLVVAIAVQVLGRLRRQPWRSLEVGSLAVFALLAVAAFVVDDDVLARWMQPLSNLGIFLVALGGLAVGRPFVREYAAASVDDRTARTDGFATITRDMTVLWVGVFAAMTVVSAIPPVVDGAATLRDDDDLLSILCFWVLPYVFLAVGGLVSGLFPPWFEKRSALVDQREAAEAPHPAAQRPSPPDVAAPPLAARAPRREQARRAVPRGRPGACPPGPRCTSRSVATTCSAGRGAPPPSSPRAVGRGARPRRDRPDGGDWSDPSDDAPIAAMRFVEPDVTPELFVPPSAPWRVTVEVRVSGADAVLRRTVERVARGAAARHVPVVIGGVGAAGRGGPRAASDDVDVAVGLAASDGRAASGGPPGSGELAASGGSAGPSGSAARCCCSAAPRTPCGRRGRWPRRSWRAAPWRRPARPVRGRRAPHPARRPAHRRAVDGRHRPRRRARPRPPLSGPPSPR